MIQSKILGDMAENEVIVYLTNIGFNAIKNEDKATRLYYDVIATDINNQVVTIEVKNDIRSLASGNVAIEYHNSKSDKPSGIMATKADWWVHKICGTLWIIRVSDLLSFTKTEKPVKVISSGGDKNANLLIYTVEQFTKAAKPLTSITKVEDLL